MTPSTHVLLRGAAGRCAPPLRVLVRAQVSQHRVQESVAAVAIVVVVVLLAVLLLLAVLVVAVLGLGLGRACAAR